MHFNFTNNKSTNVNLIVYQYIDFLLKMGV